MPKFLDLAAYVSALEELRAVVGEIVAPMHLGQSFSGRIQSTPADIDSCTYVIWNPVGHVDVFSAGQGLCKAICLHVGTLVCVGVACV